MAGITLRGYKVLRNDSADIFYDPSPDGREKQLAFYCHGDITTIYGYDIYQI